MTLTAILWNFVRKLGRARRMIVEVFRDAEHMRSEMRRRPFQMHE
jgi:hypothetical protein